jgi:fructokinase
MSINTAVFGEALFDLIEQGNDLLKAHIGGSPFNVARSFVKQGVNTTYVSPISKDRYGARIFEYAKEQGISLPSDNRSVLPTSLALVFTDESGQPDYSLYRKNVADLDITAGKLIALMPSDLNLFHTGSLALVPAMLPILIECFEALKAKQVLISLDINMRKGVESDNHAYVSAVKALTCYADIVKVSDEDLQLLGVADSPIDGAKQILASLKNTKGIVLLTEGENGATVVSTKQCLHKPVYQPKQFIDAVGAGDTFFSAFLSRLLLEKNPSFDLASHDLESALAFGLMAATINVQRHGCQPPTKQEVTSELAEHDEL